MSALSDGRNLNNVDLALLCNHSVRVFLVNLLPFLAFSSFVSLNQVLNYFCRVLVNSLKNCTLSTKQFHSYRTLRIN